MLLATFALGMAMEFVVPWVAEHRHRTPYHPEHVAERYGLFTIIVLGEVVLSSVMAVQGALDGSPVSGLLTLVLGALLVVFSMWWLYFKREHAALFASERTVFRAAYGHLFIFASVAATGAGLAAAVDVVTHHAHTTTAFVAWSVALPLVVFLLALGVTHSLDGGRRTTTVPAAVTAAGVTAITLVGLGLGASMGVMVLLMGLVLATAVAQHVWAGR